MKQTKITDGTLAAMTRLSSLKSLNLNACLYFSNKGFMQLAGSSAFQHLDSLEIMGDLISDISIIELVESPHKTAFRLLNLSDCQRISSEAVYYLLASPKCAALENLNLSLTHVNDLVLDALTENDLPNLRELRLMDCQGITNKGLLSLFQSKTVQNSLTLLDISCCSCEDGLLHALAQTPNKLKKIGLAACGNLTDEALNQYLQSAVTAAHLKILVVTMS